MQCTYTIFQIRRDLWFHAASLPGNLQRKLNSRPHLGNGRAIGMVVVRLSVRLSVRL